MKKLFALILSLVLLTALAAPAFAANYTESGNVLKPDDTATVTVQGRYNIGDAGNIYSVKVDWSGMQFTYIANTEWDAEQHKSVDNLQNGGTWEDTTGTINVTNNSNNLAVKVTMAFEATAANAEIHTAITGALTGDIDAHKIGMSEVARAQFKVTAGELKVGLADEALVNIGTITVTITAAD